jgi:hypothetical protein
LETAVFAPNATLEFSWASEGDLVSLETIPSVAGTDPVAQIAVATTSSLSLLRWNTLNGWSLVQTMQVTGLLHIATLPSRGTTAPPLVALALGNNSVAVFELTSSSVFPAMATWALDVPSGLASTSLFSVTGSVYLSAVSDSPGPSIFWLKSVQSGTQDWLAHSTIEFAGGSLTALSPQETQILISRSGTVIRVPAFVKHGKIDVSSCDADILAWLCVPNAGLVGLGSSSSAVVDLGAYCD